MGIPFQSALFLCFYVLVSENIVTNIIGIL